MGKFRALIRCACCCLFLCGAGKAAGQVARFDRLSIEDGLSQSTVNDIVQDRHGFLWVATQDGLNRWDGYQFLQFKSDPTDSTTLNEDWIQALAVGRDGRIWMGTNGGGINVLDPSSGKFRAFTPENSALKNATITDVVTYGSVLWATTHEGLARIDTDTDSLSMFRVSRAQAADRGQTEAEDSLRANRMLTASMAPSGTLWIGTDRGGLYALRPTSQILERNFLDHAFRENGVSAILSILAEREAIWVGTAGSGLFRLDPESRQAIQFGAEPGAPESAGQVQGIARTPSGRLYVGSGGAGLGVVDEASHTIRFIRNDPARDHSLPRDAVNTVYSDEEGSLWVGTSGGGLGRMHAIEWVSNSTRPALPNNHVNGVIEREDGSIWVGTDGGGVVRIDPATAAVSQWSTSTPGRRLLSDRIISMNRDRDGSLLVGTVGGLNIINPQSGSVRSIRSIPGDLSTLTDPRVFRAIPSAQHPDSLWVVTWGGLHLVDRISGRAERFLYDRDDQSSMSGNRTISAMEDSRGRLWVGTFDAGLNLQMPGEHAFRRFRAWSTDSTSLSDDRVASLLEASDGTIWIGTANGLNRFLEESGRFAVYSVRDGLPDNTIYALVEDDQGRIWMSTNNGIAARLPDSGRYVTFDVTYGLQSTEFNHGAVDKALDGHLLFGGVEGYNRFDPQELIRSVPPRAMVTALATSRTTYDPVRIPTLGRIDMPPGDNSFSIEFAASDFRSPHALRYQVRLGGEDRDWLERPADQRFASWPRLSGGTYELMVRAAGAEGVWSNPIRALEIHVVPPLADRMWFRVIAALLILGAFGGIGYMWHLGRLAALERSQKDEREVHRRLMESREAERLHLSQELHDGAVQDLYGIRFRAQAGADAVVNSGVDAKAADSNSESDAGADTVAATGAADSPGSNGLDEEVQAVITKLRQICGELRPPVLAPFGLQRTLRSHADEFRDNHPEIQVLMDLDEDAQRMPETMRLVFFRVYQEAMNNIVRHAEARRVDVSFRFDGTRASLTVADDGKGFNLPGSWLELGRKDHFGLLGVSERVRSVGGHLRVVSAPGEGTRIEVSVSDVHRTDADD